MISAAYLMIIGGMFSIILVEIGIDFQLWTKFFNGFIGLCNFYIDQLSKLDFLVFDTIRFRYWEAVLIFIAILYLRIVLLKPKYRTIIYGLILMILFEGQRIYNNYQLNRKQEIIVFHQNRNSILGIRKGKEMDILLLIQRFNRIKTYLIRPYSIQEKLER